MEEINNLVITLISSVSATQVLTMITTVIVAMINNSRKSKADNKRIERLEESVISLVGKLDEEKALNHKMIQMIEKQERRRLHIRETENEESK